MTTEAKQEQPGGRHKETSEHVANGSASSETGPRSSEEQVLELREEELRARKDTVQTGEVRIGKEVVEERQTLEVPVTREEVTIERHPVERRPAQGSITEESATIRFPVHEDQVSVEKRTVVTDEINVGKRQIQGTERASGTVRREEAHVESEGDVKTNEPR